MATARTATLEDLTKLAADFVTTQKGLWDHAAWIDFVSNVQTKGFDISRDMQSNLGSLLEAMNQFYTAAASTKSMEKAMNTVVHDSVAFVTEHRGVWNHSDWEEFVKTVQQNTLTLSEGTAGYLGGVLESIKALYGISPVVGVQKRASAARTKSSPAPQPALSAAKKAQTKPVGAKAPAKKTVAKKPSPKGADKQDDLTAISGIGPALAKKLRGAGIVSYAQVAALSNKDIAHLEKDIIKSTGRIKRDDWVGQAKKLSRKR
jgi:predicted flap endonuclease-1-like 5' DNA nuclease